MNYWFYGGFLLRSHFHSLRSHVFLLELLNLIKILTYYDSIISEVQDSTINSQRQLFNSTWYCIHLSCLNGFSSFFSLHVAFYMLTEKLMIVKILHKMKSTMGKTTHKIFSRYKCYGETSRQVFSTKKSNSNTRQCIHIFPWAPQKSAIVL